MEKLKKKHYETIKNIVMRIERKCTISNRILYAFAPEDLATGSKLADLKNWREIRRFYIAETNAIPRIGRYYRRNGVYMIDNVMLDWLRFILNKKIIKKINKNA